MPQVLTKEVKAEVGVQVRVWRDPLTMHHLQKVAVLVKPLRNEMLLHSNRHYFQIWDVMDIDGNVDAEAILVRTVDNVVVTPEMLEKWP